MALQDECLFLQIKQGNKEAFVAMIERYNKLLWVVVGGIIGKVGTLQDIEECISDVYVHVWKNPAAYDPAKGTFKTFLAVIARSKALDAYRRLSKSNIVELTDAITASDDDLLDTIIEQEKHGKLYAAIATLTEPNKEIVIRRFFFDEKPRRIAAQTAIPVRRAFEGEWRITVNTIDLGIQPLVWEGVPLGGAHIDSMSLNPFGIQFAGTHQFDTRDMRNFPTFQVTVEFNEGRNYTFSGSSGGFGPEEFNRFSFASVPINIEEVTAVIINGQCIPAP